MSYQTDSSLEIPSSSGPQSSDTSLSSGAEAAFQAIRQSDQAMSPAPIKDGLDEYQNHNVSLALRDALEIQKKVKEKNGGKRLKVATDLPKKSITNTKEAFNSLMNFKFKKPNAMGEEQKDAHHKSDDKDSDPIAETTAKIQDVDSNHQG